MHVDDKWGRADEKALVLRAAIGDTLGVPASEIALAQNSHELAVRFLSGLDWTHRRTIVTTTGEFHALAPPARSIGRNRSRDHSRSSRPINILYRSD